MTTKDIEYVINLLAKTVEVSHRASPETLEYARIGEFESTTEHDIAVIVTRAILADMPTEGGDVEWRALPKYTVRTDFSDGIKRHEIYARLLWVPQSRKP